MGLVYGKPTLNSDVKQGWRDLPYENGKREKVTKAASMWKTDKVKSEARKSSKKGLETPSFLLEGVVELVDTCVFGTYPSLFRLNATIF